MGKRHYWTVDMVEMLGTMTDAALGAKFGIPKDTVTGARIGRGISPFCIAFSVQRQWTAEEVALLGTMSDAQVARRVGRSREAVRAKRYALGIKNGVLQKHPSLDDIKRDYTSTNAPVSDIAAKYEVDIQFVTKRASKRGWVRPAHGN